MQNAPRQLTGLTVNELQTLLGSRTRAVRVVNWLTGGPVRTELPPTLEGVSRRSWQAVREACELPKFEIIEGHLSEDGTKKFLIALGDVTVETVLIPARGRSTVCVSSQAGCTRKCAFCATATLGFKRQLSAAEILTQYLIARAEAPPDAPATNVVFMGMGEPMDNLDEVLRAVALLTQSPGPNLGAQQVTVSTSGVLPGMKRFLRESRGSLALSLNASSDAQRTALMPQNKTWPIGALMDVLREDAVHHPKRVHFIEYVLFAGINDTEEDAGRVAAVLQGVNARVNLIPHNAIAGSELRPPSRERVVEFQQALRERGLRALIRWPRGREIAAACGQLALKRPLSANEVVR